jgi:hypothetical protein
LPTLWALGRYRREKLVSEPVVENGQTDWKGGFRYRWATIFTRPMAIRRYAGNLGKAEAQVKDQDEGGRLAAEKRIFLPWGNYFHRLVFLPAQEWASQKIARKSTEQTGRKARIFEIFDLAAVTLPELMPISEYRVRERRSLIQN